MKRGTVYKRLVKTGKKLFDAGILTQATLEGGECTHHCANLDIR